MHNLNLTLHVSKPRKFIFTGKYVKWSPQILKSWYMGDNITVLVIYFFSLENNSNANSFCSQCPIFRLCRIKKMNLGQGLFWKSNRDSNSLIELKLGVKWTSSPKCWLDGIHFFNSVLQHWWYFQWQIMYISKNFHYFTS